jgi:hypothetical protein
LPHAEVIAGAEEARARGVPNGECEIAEKPCRALLAPTLVGGEYDFPVPDIMRGARAEVELGDEFGAVVEASVGRDGEPGMLARERQAFGDRFGGSVERALTESRASLSPDSDRIIAPVRKGVEHAVERIASGRSPVPV